MKVKSSDHRLNLRRHDRRIKSARRLLGALVCLAVLVPTESARAQDPAGWIGGLFGISVPNADNTTARTIYGATGGAKLGSEWGIGGYYLTSSKDENVSGGTSKFQYEFYGIEGAYHFEGEARGAYLGGRVGLSKVASGTSFSTSPTHYGAIGGYNHMVTNHFSLGGETSFMIVPDSTGTPVGSSVSQTIKGFSMINFVASAKFWF